MAVLPIVQKIGYVLQAACSARFFEKLLILILKRGRGLKA